MNYYTSEYNSQPMYIDCNAKPTHPNNYECLEMYIDYNAKPFNGEWLEEETECSDLCDIEIAELSLKSEHKLKPVIENLFYRKQVGFLYGDSNTGKSFCALSLLNRVANGQCWSGLRVAKDCHAFYFDGETGVELLGRNHAWNMKFNGGTKNNRMHILAPKFNIYDSEIQNRVINSINKMTGGKGGIVCFDTLSSFLANFDKRTLGGGVLDMENPDENDAIAMRKLVSIMKRIAVETNSFVFMVHHNGKDTTKGMKGAATLKNDSDTVIRLEQLPNDEMANDAAITAALIVEKNRGCSKLSTMKFKLVREHNGISHAELHDIDSELCQKPQGLMQIGYQVNDPTKTLVFLDDPRPLNIYDENIIDGKKSGKPLRQKELSPQDKLDAARDLKFVENNINQPTNEYAQMYTAQRQPMTQQQQQRQLEQNSVNAESYQAGANYTATAAQDNALAYNCYLNAFKKKGASAQKKAFEKIIMLSKNSFDGCANESDVLNILKDEFAMQSNNSKRAIEGLLKGRVISNDKGKIRIIKPPAQIMS